MSQAKAHSINMLEGPILGKIMLFAVPFAIASILQQLLNTVDTAVVGQMVGGPELAAVGATAPVFTLLIGLFTGLSIGANVVIASNIGMGRNDLIKRSIDTSMVLALGSGILVLVICFFLAAPMMQLIQTKPEFIPDAELYLRVMFLGMPLSMVYNFGSAVLRSKGDTKRPLYALAAACVVNLVLDLLFAWIGWGVAGVAAATAIANSLSGIIILFYMARDEGPFEFHYRNLELDRSQLKRILQIGIPAGVQGIVFSISNLVIQSSINGFGEYAMAGSAAALNFEVFGFFIVNAFAQACVTFTSQNYAAKKYDRCKKVFRICMLLGLVLTACLSSVFALFDHFFIGIFTPVAGAATLGLVRFWHVGVLELLTGTYEISGGALRGMGWSTLPSVITIFGTCVLRIVYVVAFFPMLGAFEDLMIIYPISWIATGVLMLVSYFIVRRRCFKPLPAPQEQAAELAAAPQE